MLDRKEYRAVDMGFPAIGGLIYHTTEFENGTSLTILLFMYFDLMYKVTTQKCGQGWCGTEVSRLHEDIYAFKQNVVTIFARMHIRTLLAQIPPLGPFGSGDFRI